MGLYHSLYENRSVLRVLSAGRIYPVLSDSAWERGKSRTWERVNSRTWVTQTIERNKDLPRNSASDRSQMSLGGTFVEMPLIT